MGISTSPCRSTRAKGSIAASPGSAASPSPYRIDRTEVTNAAFAAWLGRQPSLVERQGAGDEPGDRYVADDEGLLVHLYPRYGVFGIAREEGRYFARRGYEQRPVTQVSWRAAVRFCADRGGRLPTEAEWERTARGPRGDRFPWGDGEPSCAGVSYGRSQGGVCHGGLATGPDDVGVAAEDVSVEGVRDLGGNVAEWVLDHFAERYDSCPEPCRDPAVRFVLSDGDPYHVVRGGSFERAAEGCRGSGRMRRRGDDVLGDVGFRCAYPSDGPPRWPERFWP